MSKNTAVATFVGALLVFFCLLSGTTVADNPVYWTFDVETHGEPVYWDSPTYIDSYYSQYDYVYQITELEVEVGIGFATTWIDVTDQLGDDATESDTYYGSPPVDLYNEHFEDDTTGSSADVKIWIDENGYGHVSITNISLGSYSGLDIRGLHATGSLDATGVPEPITVFTFTGVGLVLMIRRRKFST